MQRKKKLINFDLDTNKLKNVYSTATGHDYTNAYKELGSFFHKIGFDWRQGSSYVSKKSLTIADVTSIISLAKNNFFWLADCTKKIDVTDIGKQFDLTPLFKDDADIEIDISTPLPFMDKESPDSSQNKSLSSLDEKLRLAREKQQKSTSKSPSKAIDLNAFDVAR